MGQLIVPDSIGVRNGKMHLQPSAKSIQTTDSFQNFLTRTGVNAGNISSASSYGFNPITRNRIQLQWMYRGSWICGKVVDCPAEDMTRNGVDVQSDDKPDKAEVFKKYVKHLQLWPKLCETAKWSRLYGGALAYFMIDGQDPSTPLRKETVGLNQFKGIRPLDRWMVQPSLNDLIDEPGPTQGDPRYYEFVLDQSTMGMGRGRIHHSRVMRLEGIRLPYWERITENYWGISVLERLFDRLIAFDSTTAGTAQLVYKAHLRTYAVKDLRQILAAGGQAYEGLCKQIAAMRLFQSNEGITLMDADDKFEVAEYGFGGLDAVLLSFGQQLSGASDIPMVRLFGQSPGGLNATGESDLRTYHEGIKRQQETDLATGLELAYYLAYRSSFGADPPKSFALEFEPLWELNDKDGADVTNSLTAAILEAFEKGVIKRSTALQELRKIARITGAFASISDDEITEAESDPAPTPEALGLRAPKPAPAPNAGPEAKSGAAKPDANKGS